MKSPQRSLPALEKLAPPGSTNHYPPPHPCFVCLPHSTAPPLPLALSRVYETPWSLQFPSGSATPTQRLPCPPSAALKLRILPFMSPSPHSLSLLPLQPHSPPPPPHAFSNQGCPGAAPTPTLTLTSPRCEMEQKKDGRLSPGPTAGSAAWGFKPRA